MFPLSLNRFELRKCLEVTRVEVTDILNTVFHHSKSCETETKRKARILLGINATLFENVGVNHTAGTKLKPARVLAGGTAVTTANLTVDVKLKAGLDEGEEAGTQTNLNILLKYLGEHSLHKVNKVRDGYVLVDHHTLHLEEGVLVAGVGGLVTEATSGEDSTKGCAVLLHNVILRCRCL